MFHPDHSFLESLEVQHPMLRRILLICRHRYRTDAGSIEGADPVLWEKIDGKPWSPRPVPHLDYWEIVHDKLDEV
jgi:hypothetical protein